jgi:hypothetical protein
MMSEETTQETAIVSEYTKFDISVEDPDAKNKLLIIFCNADGSQIDLVLNRKAEGVWEKTISIPNAFFKDAIKDPKGVEVLKKLEVLVC